ncbi:MAG TPA: hypothetical protein PLJ16_08040 [Casimicrobium huifangae]|nr:hypothetical protein [Casimicrobium huifangae]
MGKPFHELTETERAALSESGMTFGQVAAEHPQPEWCDYPDAVSPLGCWSLTGGMVPGIEYCKNCDCLRSNPGGKPASEARSA